MKLGWTAMVAALVIGCAAEQHPVKFAVTQPGDAVTTLARALANEGLVPAEVRPGEGILVTQWADTGFMYGQIGEQVATIVRRYVAVIGPSSTGAEVTLRAETQRCARGTFNPQTGTGACEQMNGLVPQHQSDLDQLGYRLKQQLGAH